MMDFFANSSMCQLAVVFITLFFVCSFNIAEYFSAIIGGVQVSALVIFPMTVSSPRLRGICLSAMK